MKSLRTIALAGASVLAMTAAAHADPVSIGFALFAGPLGSIFSFSALVTATQIGLYALPIAASLALSALNKPKIDPGQYKNTLDLPDSGEINAIGRVRVSGLKAFGDTNGFDRYRLIWHAKGELIAIEEWLLGGREVTVESNGAVSSPPFGKPSDDDDSDSYVWIQTKIGDGTEIAWPDLISAFPSLWTSAHRCRGIAQSLVKYISPGIYTKKFGALYQGGEPPLSITARFKYSYDPREAGQSKDDDTTWTWSMNGPLCAARILLMFPEVSVDLIDWDFIAGQADAADALVATKTGTEPRSRCSGVWPSDDHDRVEVMQQVLDSIGAEIVMSDDGLIRIRLIDDAPEAEIAYPAEYQTDFNWKSGPDAVSRPNMVTLKYYSPEMNYEMAEVDLSGIAWANIEDEIAVYGEKKLEIDLPFCMSASQAQRIGRRKFALARADTGTIQTNMAGLAAWGLTYADIEDETAEETMLTKMEPPRIDDANGKVEIPFTVWPSLTAWNPATDEADAPEQIPPLQYVADIAKPGTPTKAVPVQYPDGSWELRVAYPTPAETATIEAVFRTYGDDGPNPWKSMTEIGSNFAYRSIDAHGVKADFRLRCFDSDLEGSDWSDTLSVDDLEIDNTACAAPDVTVVSLPRDGAQASYDFTVSDVQAATVVVTAQFDGSPSIDFTQTINVRPGATSSVDVSGFSNSTINDKTVDVTFIAYTSGDVAGASTVKSFTVAGTGGA